MQGLWVLGLLIGIAALPLLPLYLWFRMSKFPLSTKHFLLALLTGAFSLVLALALQLIFSGVAYRPTLGAVLGEVFLRIALTEELGRFFALLLFFFFEKIVIKEKAQAVPVRAAVGLVAGFGFALVESASYGAADLNNALVRAVTAAPLHGACGARVGRVFSLYAIKPVTAFVQFISAVGIHGLYNLLVISPGIAGIVPVFVSFAALVASMQAMRREL
ncbi:MAG: PrsW family intramembrane metalloprotease [Spirochaetaceae bacterium]|jgi:RsiW-degrading membrane proteinase PrsW (M82 family)|nr:PrsW family intramembrane metalloprotease [Spirochaetaceae bacterium]